MDRSPTLFRLHQIAEALGVEVTELLGTSGKNRHAADCLELINCFMQIEDHDKRETLLKNAREYCRNGR